GPSRVVVKSHAGEIMLAIEQVRPDGGSDEMRDDLGQQPGLPAAEVEQNSRNDEMQGEGDETIEMFLFMVQKRIQAHRVEKHEHVAEQNGERMTHEQVVAAFGWRRFDELLLGHDGIRTDLRTPELGVMVVMMVMGTPPD